MSANKPEKRLADSVLFFIAALWGGTLKVILFGTKSYGALPTIIWYLLCFWLTKFIYNKYKSQKPKSTNNNIDIPDTPDVLNTSTIEKRNTTSDDTIDNSVPASEADTLQEKPPEDSRSNAASADQQIPATKRELSPKPSLHIPAPLLVATGALISLGIMLLLPTVACLPNNWYKCIGCDKCYYLSAEERYTTADGYCEECTKNLGFEYCILCAFELASPDDEQNYDYGSREITSPYFATDIAHYHRYDKNAIITELCPSHFLECYLTGNWQLSYSRMTHTYKLHPKAE